MNCRVVRAGDAETGGVGDCVVVGVGIDGDGRPKVGSSCGIGDCAVGACVEEDTRAGVGGAIGVGYCGVVA